MAPANSMIKLPTIIQGISKLVDGLFFQQNLLCVKASSNSVSCLKIYLWGGNIFMWIVLHDDSFENWDNKPHGNGPNRLSIYRVQLSNHQSKRD